MHLYKRLYSFFHVSQPETTFFRHNFCIFPINFIQTFYPPPPPSSFLILPFAADNFPFFRSLFVNLTSLSCFFFFLPSNFLHGSAACTAFSRLDGILYTTPFFFSPSSCWDLIFSSFILFSV